MTETQFGAIVFLLTGAVFVATGLPLLLGRVRPNLWYGCRTERTLSDEALWYRANRTLGRGLVLVGALGSLFATAIYFLFSGTASDAWVIALLVWFVGGVFVAARLSWKAD